MGRTGNHARQGLWLLLMVNHTISTNDYTGGDRDRRATHAFYFHRYRCVKQFSSSLGALLRLSTQPVLIGIASATIHSRGRDSCSGLALPVARFWTAFSLVSMVSINLGIWFYGVETGDAGESIEPEESH